MLTSRLTRIIQELQTVFLADEAKFQYLRGLTIDEDGNIFVCQGIIVT